MAASASASVAATLAQLESSSTSQTSKASGYQELLTSITSPPSSTITQDLPAFTNSILLPGNLGIISARPLLSSAISSLSTLASTDDQISIGESLLASLADKTSTFGDADIALRKILAAAYQAAESFILAAQTLEGISLDSSSSAVRYSDVARVAHWITICRLYIEEDDMLAAETFLNKAKTLRHRIGTETDTSSPSEQAELILNFALCQARILDSKRDFLDASNAYYSVSQSTALAEEDRLASLTQAITTAVLSPAGPQRGKLLGRLFKDERSASLDSYSVLSSMYLERLVLPAEISSFSASLAPHQLATTSDGSTVLAKAMVEHNILAASKLYANLDFGTLGRLLGLDEAKAEAVAAGMVQQGRIRGQIDQIEGVIDFERGGEIRRWDGGVRSLVEDVERVAGLCV